MEEQEMLQLLKGTLMTHLAGYILVSYVHVSSLLVKRSGHHTTLLPINGLIILNPRLIQNIRKATKKQKCHSERQNVYKTAITVDDPRARQLSIEDDTATARPFTQEDCVGMRPPRNNYPFDAERLLKSSRSEPFKN
jgi:hypothetical protein